MEYLYRTHLKWKMADSYLMNIYVPITGSIKWMATGINFDTARINAKVVRRNCKGIVLSKCLDKKAKQRSRKVSKLPFMWVT